MPIFEQPDCVWSVAVLDTSSRLNTNPRAALQVVQPPIRSDLSSAGQVVLASTICPRPGSPPRCFLEKFRIRERAIQRWPAPVVLRSALERSATSSAGCGLQARTVHPWNRQWLMAIRTYGLPSAVLLGLRRIVAPAATRRVAGLARPIAIAALPSSLGTTSGTTSASLGSSCAASFAFGHLELLFL